MPINVIIIYYNCVDKNSKKGHYWPISGNVDDSKKPDYSLYV